MTYQIDIPKRTRCEIDQLPGHIRQRVTRVITSLQALQASAIPQIGVLDHNCIDDD
jgi:hypothetical protein